MNNDDKQYAVIGQRYPITKWRTENKDALAGMFKFASTMVEAEEHVKAFIERYDASIVWLSIIDMDVGIVRRVRE